MQQPISGLIRPIVHVSRSHKPGRMLNMWSARRRSLYLHNIQQTREKNINILSEIRTRGLSNQAAADLRLRPHGNGISWSSYIHLLNPLNAELNPICHLLALLGAHPILHVSRIRVNSGVKGLNVPWKISCTFIHFILWMNILAVTGFKLLLFSYSFMF